MTRHRTHILVETGEVIKELNPKSIATLLFIIDEKITYQTEMADRLDISPAPISNTLRSLEELPVPLVEKHRKYELTEAGEKAISLLDKSVLRFGMDICDIDWSDENQKEKLNNMFAPLNNARSSRPFLVLESINQLNGETTINRVVENVKDMRSDQNKVASKKQIKRTVDWFANHDVVKLEDGVRFTEHGEEQAHLLCDFMDFIESLPNDEPSTETHQEGVEEYSEIFIPAYHPPDSETAIPLSSTTVGELYQHANKLHEKYDHDTQLNLVWMKKKYPTTP